MLRLAAIGLGGRVSGMVSNFMKADPDLRLTGLVDPRGDEALANLKRWELDVSTVKHYDSHEAMLADPSQFDGIVIGTRCHLHTPIAVAVEKTGLPLFLEKPVSITREQVEALAAAYQHRYDSVVVSFPLRTSPLFRNALDIVRSGRLGTVNQIVAWNDVPYGGVYFGNWYRNFDEVGGLWLQKATHDLDYIQLLAGSMPTMLAAMNSRSVYGGDKPHELACRDCDEKNTCIEGPAAQAARGDNGGMGNDHMCAYSREIANQDAGSVMIRYANGIHATYTQNFIARRSAGRRGARIIGHAGTLEFDWYTERIKVIDHHGAKRIDDIEVKAATGHHGGDTELSQNFVALMRGEEKSHSDLRAGVLSATTCIAARESANTGSFVPVVMPCESNSYPPHGEVRELVTV